MHVKEIIYLVYNFFLFFLQVSIILPESNNIPDSVKDCISEDSDYYKIKDFHVSELVNKQFIDAFIKNGKGIFFCRIDILCNILYLSFSLSVGMH